MFHKDPTSSKSDLRRGRGRFELNLRILCLFSPKILQMAASQLRVQKPGSLPPKQSPAKLVNLNLCYTLESPGGISKMTFGCTPKQWHQSLRVGWACITMQALVFLFFLTFQVIPKYSGVWAPLFQAWTKGTFSNWHLCAEDREPAMERRKRRVKSVTCSYTLSSPISIIGCNSSDLKRFYHLRTRNNPEGKEYLPLPPF